MDVLQFLFDYFKPAELYARAFDIADVVATTLAPMLLVLAVSLRLAQTQMENIDSGQSKWGKFFNDVTLYAFLLAAYFALGNLIGTFFNGLYAWADRWGSLGSVLQQMEILSDRVLDDAIASATDTESFNPFAILGNLAAAPATLLSYGFYYLSLLVVVAITLLFRLAHAFAFGVVFIWGLIAIPLSITSQIKLLKGWGILCGVVLVWPLVEATIVYMFSGMFLSFTTTIAAGDATGVSALDLAGLYFLFTVLNLIITAIVFSAPFIAQSLLNNSGSAGAMLGSFASAGFASATAAGATMAAQGRTMLRGSAGALGGAANSKPVRGAITHMAAALGNSDAQNAVIQQRLARHPPAKTPDFRPLQGSQRPGAPPPPRGSGARAQAAKATGQGPVSLADSGAELDSQAAELPAVAPEPQGPLARRRLTPQQRQRRRGAIISAQRKRHQGKGQ